jgi:hypothetical protein
VKLSISGFVALIKLRKKKPLNELDTVEDLIMNSVGWAQNPMHYDGCIVDYAL